MVLVKLSKPSRIVTTLSVLFTIALAGAGGCDRPKRPKPRAAATPPKPESHFNIEERLAALATVAAAFESDTPLLDKPLARPEPQIRCYRNPLGGWNTLVVPIEDRNALRDLADRGAEILPKEPPRLEPLRWPKNLVREAAEVLHGHGDHDHKKVMQRLNQIKYVVFLQNARMPQRGSVTRTMTPLLANRDRMRIQNIPDVRFTRCKTEAEALVYQVEGARFLGGFAIQGENDSNVLFRETGSLQEQLEANAWRSLITAVETEAERYFQDAENAAAEP